MKKCKFKKYLWQGMKEIEVNIDFIFNKLSLSLGQGNKDYNKV